MNMVTTCKCDSDMSVLSAKPTVNHSDHKLAATLAATVQAELSIMKELGASIAHCPLSNFFFAHGALPATGSRESAFHSTRLVQADWIPFLGLTTFTFHPPTISSLKFFGTEWKRCTIPLPEGIARDQRSFLCVWQGRAVDIELRFGSWGKGGTNRWMTKEERGSQNCEKGVLKCSEGCNR